MQLNGAQISLLSKALLNVFPHPDDLRNSLRPLEINFDQITSIHSNYETRILDLILKAQGHNWIPKLVDCIRSINAQNEYLRQLEQELMLDATSTSVDHYEARLLWGSTPFVDRVNFRKGLKALELGRKAVLVVNGDAKSGKSWSLNLVSYVVEKRQGAQVIFIDLVERNATLRRPADVFMGIMIDIQDDLADKKDLKPPETGRELQIMYRRLAAQITQYRKPIWLVIDGISQVSVPQATKDLVKWLMQDADRGLISNLRVILLGFDEAVLARPRTQMESIQEITAEELHLVFVSKARLDSVTLNEADSMREAERIVASLKARRDEGLSPLLDEIERAYQLLFAREDG